LRERPTVIDKLCLFAHFDPRGEIAAYVERYLAALKACGFEIVFITPTKLSEDGRARVKAICLDVIERDNRGLDFGSWQAGFARYGELCEHELLLANDSVYGPIGDLGAALDRLRTLPGDIRGFVRSEERASHLQSWLMLLSPAAFRSEAFARFMSQDFASMTKSEIIRRGEVGLLDALAGEGLSMAALYAASPEYSHRLISRFNPTHVLWRELIETHGVPFLKVELLRDNPASISDVGLWRDVVTQHAPELTPMIEAHRNATGTDWAGKSAPRRRMRWMRWMSAEGFMRRDEELRRRGARVRRLLNAGLFAPLSRTGHALRVVMHRIPPF
jgi:Rhamnan synthesis protein F